MEVGKTSIRRKYIDHNFVNDHITTIGADISLKIEKISEELELHLQIWDLSGQHGFKSILDRYLTGFSAAFLIFDVTNPLSFNNLDNWIKILFENHPLDNFPILILGNKNDLSPKLIAPNQIESFISKIKKKYKINSNIVYFFTSAKTGENIMEVFSWLTNYFLKNKILLK